MNILYPVLITLRLRLFTEKADFINTKSCSFLLNVKFLVKVYLCSFYCKCMLYSMLGGTSFYCRSLIFFQLLLFLVIIYYCFQYWSCSFPIFACRTFPSHRRKWDIATRDDIIPLPWKQSRFYLWTFCSLRRGDQGLIMVSLGFVMFMVFKLQLINQKNAAQKMKFSIKDFVSKCDQIRSFYYKFFLLEIFFCYFKIRISKTIIKTIEVSPEHLHLYFISFFVQIVDCYI